jgi:hypothetical protein
MPEDGQPPLTPKQIPPLVHQHLPWLPPVAGNKRYNAVIREMDLRGRWREKTVAPLESETRERRKLERNLERFSVLLSQADLRRETLSTGQETASCLVGIVDTDAVLTLMKSYEWAGTLKPLQLEIEYLEGRGQYKAETDDWVVIAPQLKNRAPEGWIWSAAGFDFDIKSRSRIGERIKVYSEPEHRRLAEHITGLTPAAVPNAELQALAQRRRGVLLFYPVWTAQPPGVPDFEPIAGFSQLFPGVKQVNRAVWQVLDRSRQDDAVIDAS